MKYFILFILLLNILFASDSLIRKANTLLAEKHYKQAIQIYKKLAKKNNPAAINNLAMIYYNGLGVDYKQEKAVKMLRRLVDENVTNCQVYYNLAVMLYDGYVDSKTFQLYIDRGDAYKILQKAKKIGCRKAKFYIKRIIDLNKDTNATKK